MNKSSLFIHHKVIKESRIYFLLSLKLSNKHLCVRILDFGPQVMVIVLQIPQCAPNILKSTVNNMEKSICLGHVNASLMKIEQSTLSPLTNIMVRSYQVPLIQRYKTMVVLLHH